VADDVTIFSLEVLPEGWFAPELKGDGWFHYDLLDQAATGGGVNINGASPLGAISSVSEIDVLIAITGANTLGAIAQTNAISIPISISGASNIGAIAAASEIDVRIGITGASQIQALTQTSSITISSGPLNINGTNTIGNIGQSSLITLSSAFQAKGDDAYFNRRPIVSIRPKAEREVDAVLEIIETAQVTQRTGQRRKTVKEAVERISVISAPPMYQEALASIEKMLVSASRAAAIHEGVQAAIDKAAVDLQAILEKMETRRLKKRREEEILVSWLLN
jgi:ribosome-associated translation inhibitor RaiA